MPHIRWPLDSASLIFKGLLQKILAILDRNLLKCNFSIERFAMQFKLFTRFLVIVSTTVFLATLPAHAASYNSLVKKGFSVGKLLKYRGGVLGWFLSDGKLKYFCKMKTSVAYKGTKGMISFTVSGSIVGLDRKTFDRYMGGPDKTIPQYSNLKTGKSLHRRDVGSCRKIRK